MGTSAGVGAANLATHLSTRIATVIASADFTLFGFWQPTCLRGLQPRLTLCQEVALTTGNPLVYEDCNCKIFVICECYSTKDLLSYGGKCKKYLHGAKALDLIPITFYYRTNSP